MSEAIQAYARARRFSAATLDRWLRHGAADGEALLSVAERLRLGENQLRDVLDAVDDIVTRRGCTVAEVLADQFVVGALQGGRGRNETIHALKAALRRLRYPQLTATEAELNALVRALRLPRGVQMRFPENLEGEEVTLTLRAASAQQLRLQVRELAALVLCDEIATMFHLLAGE